MSQSDRIRHILFRLIAGKTEHHALVAGADCIQLSLRHRVFLRFQSLVYAHSDIRGLFVQGYDHTAGIAVKAVFRAVIADLANRLADYLLDIHVCVSGHLTHNQYKTCGTAGLTGHTAHRVLL